MGDDCNTASRHGAIHVAKFGGTSLGKFLDNIAEIIVPYAVYCIVSSYYLRFSREELHSGHRLVLVCSARSGDSKATGTTNLLLKAAMEALQANDSIESSTNQPHGLANDRFHSPPRTPTSGTPNGNSGHPNRHLLPRTASSSVVNGFGNSSQPSPPTQLYFLVDDRIAKAGGIDKLLSVAQ